MKLFSEIIKEFDSQNPVTEQDAIDKQLLEVNKMSKAERKALWDKAKKGNAVTLPAVDKDKYPNREKQGLEGPFRFRSGIVLYYDTKAGKYYDPRKDMYLDDDEFMAHQAGSRRVYREETELNEVLDTKLFIEFKSYRAYQDALPILKPMFNKLRFNGSNMSTPANQGDIPVNVAFYCSPLKAVQVVEFIKKNCSKYVTPSTLKEHVQNEEVDVREDTEYLPEVVQVAPKYAKIKELNRIGKMNITIDKVSDYYIATTTGITGKQEQVAWSKIGEQLQKWLDQQGLTKGVMQVVYTKDAKKGLDERKLTKPEEKKKEEVVKSMKKNSDDFKDRYGDKAKSVMYATATKIAKKNEETSVVSKPFTLRFGEFISRLDEESENATLKENLVQYFVEKGKTEADAREYVSSIRKEELNKIRQNLNERKVLDKDKKEAFKNLEDINKQFHLSPAAYKKAKDAISNAKEIEDIHKAMAAVTEEAKTEDQVSLTENSIHLDVKGIVKDILRDKD